MKPIKSDAATQTKTPIGFDNQDIVMELSFESKKFDQSSIHTSEFTDSKFINLIRCKSDKRITKKERRNKSVGKP